MAADVSEQAWNEASHNPGWTNGQVLRLENLFRYPVSHLRHHRSQIRVE